MISHCLSTEELLGGGGKKAERGAPVEGHQRIRRRSQRSAVFVRRSFAAAAHHFVVAVWYFRLASDSSDTRTANLPSHYDAMWRVFWLLTLAAVAAGEFISPRNSFIMYK